MLDVVCTIERYVVIEDTDHLWIKILQGRER